MIDMPQQMNGAPAPLFRITSATDVFGPPSGLSAPARLKRVTYVMWNEDTGFVDVPYAPGWVERARELIDAAAREHHDLLTTQAPPVP